MKQSLVYIFAFMLATATLHAQETIDTAQFRAVYTFAYKTRPELARFDERDLMRLDMGNRVTKFYSHYTQMRDSVKKEGLENNLSPMEIQDLRRGIPWGTDPVYYQWLDKKRVLVSTVFLHNGYMYEEPLEMPVWTLHEDTMTVLGYLCKRATTHFRGRDWEVYYAPEIQLSRGPWKLWGLPGLITRATDADHYFLFEMDLFKRLSGPVPIIYIHRGLGNKGGYTGDEYKKVPKKTYVEYEKSFHKNALNFMDFELGGGITTKSKGGDPYPELPYIPLEK